jgi:hypothetical protein
MLVGTIAVTVNEPFAFDYLDQRLKLFVYTRRNLGLLRSKIIPPLFLIARTAERFPDRFHRAHPGTRVTRGLARLKSRARPLYVLAKSELYPRRGVRDRIILYGAAPFEFDRRALPANRVRRTVQKQCGRDAAGKRSINGNVVRVQHIANARHRGDRQRPFVNGGQHRVRMSVDYSGRDVLACCVDHLSSGTRRDSLADTRYFAVAYQDVRALERPACGGHHCRVFDHDLDCRLSHDGDD